MPKCINYILPFFILSTISLPALTHQKASLFDDNSIKVLAATTYRNNQINNNNNIWQPQGYLLGGEAVPSEKGLSLDDVQLLGYLNVNNNYYVASKISGHSHSGENSIELENLWIGTEFYLSEQLIQLEAGKITTEVSDSLNYHSSTDTFSQAPLSTDILFGRHFNDLGARVTFINQNYKLGLELFNGENFPSTSGDGSISAYSHWNLEANNIKFSVKAWLMYSRAVLREDTRYSDEHSHGVNLDGLIESFFSGDTLNSGLYVGATSVYENWRFHSEFEWINTQVDGQVFTETQNATMDSEQNAYRLTASLGRKNHSLHLEYEILSTKNQFGQTTQTFVEQVGLSNNGFEPNRASIGWHYAFHPDFTLRTEWIKDESYEPGLINHIVSLGVQWRYNIL